MSAPPHCSYMNINVCFCLHLHLCSFQDRQLGNVLIFMMFVSKQQSTYATMTIKNVSISMLFIVPYQIRLKQNICLLFRECKSKFVKICSLLGGGGRYKGFSAELKYIFTLICIEEGVMLTPLLSCGIHYI